jgi:hypothetical protein
VATVPRLRDERFSGSEDRGDSPGHAPSEGKLYAAHDLAEGALTATQSAADSAGISGHIQARHTGADVWTPSTSPGVGSIARGAGLPPVSR